MRVITIVGARPQFIKAAAISRAIRNHFSTSIEEIIMHTGQHYDSNMSDVFFTDLGIPAPQYHLGIGSLTHSQQTGRMMEAIEKILVLKKPRAVIVYGDTNTTLAGALSAAKLHIPVVHIEAGLRSFNKSMPEEINRVLTDHVSTLLFSPTETGIKNLRAEGYREHRGGNHTADHPGIYHSGDIMLDNTLYFSELAEKRSEVLSKLNPGGKPYILATIHRPSNTDKCQHLQSIMSALNDIAHTGMKIILPLHPRTRARLHEQHNQDTLNMVQNNPHIVLADPVSFLDMILLEKNAEIIITDSGGVQKEAYFLRRPSIIVREETEWVEIVKTGNAALCGAQRMKILKAFERFANYKPTYYPEFFGDGNAARFICKTINNTI